MNEEIKFTKEQIDYAKHCLEHFEVLTGGRGHSKTKQIIEQLQQENQQLKSLLSRETNRKEIATYDNAQLDKQLDLYKSVLNEVREHCECMIKIYGQLTKKQQQEELQKFLPYDKILTILDKVGDK